MSEINVLVCVIDSVKPRRTCIVEALNKTGSLNVEPVQYWKERYPSSGDVVADRLLLVHYGDQDALASLTPFQPRLVVYYGGNGEPDSRWKYPPLKTADRDERVWRAIGQNGDGGLDVDEMRQLINYAHHLRDEKPPSKPAFLQPPSKCDTLVALSILCQGYLAVVDPVKLGLDAKDQEVLRSNDLANIVNDPWWWVHIFGEYPDKATPSVLPTAVGKLMKSVAMELPETSESRKPIDALLGAFLDKPQLTAAVFPAWTAIKEYLEVSTQSITSRKITLVQ